MKNKRETLQIIRDILILFKKDIRIKKTKLIYKSNLSQDMANIYFLKLVDSGLMKELINEKGKREYKITQKGNDFLKDYKKVYEKFLDKYEIKEFVVRE